MRNLFFLFLMSLCFFMSSPLLFGESGGYQDEIISQKKKELQKYEREIDLINARLSILKDQEAYYNEEIIKIDRMLQELKARNSQISEDIYKEIHRKLDKIEADFKTLSTKKK